TATSLAMPRNITRWQTDQSSDQPPSTPSCFFGTGARIGGSPCGGALGGGSRRGGSFDGGSRRFGSFGFGSFAGAGFGSFSGIGADYGARARRRRESTKSLTPRAMASAVPSWNRPLFSRT